MPLGDFDEKYDFIDFPDMYMLDTINSERARQQIKGKIFFNEIFLDYLNLMDTLGYRLLIFDMKDYWIVYTCSFMLDNPLHLTPKIHSCRC